MELFRDSQHPCVGAQDRGSIAGDGSGSVGHRALMIYRRVVKHSSATTLRVARY